jgi:D-beta-D-heptose 7-phosphate kinase/D-beta-D-heptose 1-phosphate adenosyltransferase
MGLIVPREAFRALRDSLDGARIVFTNGCFDLLHSGHLTLLNHAAALGDALVVGLNSDESVRRLKGPERPVVPQQERAQMLAALRCVDFVIVYEETQAVETIRAVRPHLYVKGGDYRRDEIPEVPLVEALGGEVVLVPHVPDRSTTRLINGVRTRTDDTA